MAKAKYKLGMLIEYVCNEGEPNRSSRIEGVVQRPAGFSYEVAGDETEVAEDQVTASYRQVVKKEKKASTKGAAPRKNAKEKKTENQPSVN
jgi:hypothetical protein